MVYLIITQIALALFIGGYFIRKHAKTENYYRTKVALVFTVIGCTPVIYPILVVLVLASIPDIFEYITKLLIKHYRNK